MELYDYTVHEIAEKLESGAITSYDLVKSYFDRIREKDGQVKAYVSTLEEDALNQAKDIDERRKKGEKLGKYAGVPIGIKDNMNIKGTKTTCSSKMLENYESPYDATVIEKLRKEDIIFLGKLNMDEFAMGGSTENSAFFKTHNPYDLSCVPGGSSGGSAAAVSASLAPWTLGSDTGGSIRQPASLCGVVGLKPTYGLVSRYGLVAFASSLDQIGPITKDVTDSAILLNLISGHDEKDSTSSKREKVDYTKSLLNDVKGMKIGLPKEFLSDGVNEEVKNAILEVAEKYRELGAEVEECTLDIGKYALATYYIIACAEASSNLGRFDGIRYGYRTEKLENLEKAIKTYQSLGAKIEEFSLDIAQYALATYYIIACAEASSNLGRFDGIRYGYRAKEFGSLKELYKKSRSEGFGAEVKRRIILGTYVLSSGYYDAYYKKAQKVRTIIKEEYNKLFEKFDLILTPTSPTTAFKIGEKSNNPLEMYMSDICTVPVNIAGLPGMSIPCKLDSKGLPIGFLLIGNSFEEEKIFRAGFTYEQNTNFKENKPTFKGGEN